MVKSLDNVRSLSNCPVRSDQSVLKWNAQVLRTGSGQNSPARGSQPLSSPAPVDQSARIRRVVVGRNVGPFHLNWPERFFAAGHSRQMESDLHFDETKLWNWSISCLVRKNFNILCFSRKNIHTFWPRLHSTG